MEHSGMHVEPTTHMLSLAFRSQQLLYVLAFRSQAYSGTSKFKAQLKVKLASSLSLNDNSVLQLIKNHISQVLIAILNYYVLRAISYGSM